MTRRFSAEHRVRLSTAALRRKYPPDWADHCHNAQRDVYEKLSAVTKAKISRAGTTHSVVTKNKMRIAHKGMIYTHKKGCGCAFHTIPVTVLEHALSLLLQSAEFEFEAQKRFGYYTVDAWVPSRNIVFEADGSWHHQDKGKERRRDAHLLEKGVTAVIHLDECDLDPWLEAK